VVYPEVVAKFEDIQQQLRDQKASWTENVRPALLTHLETVLPVTDLAKLALSYVDGSGLPFASEAAEEADGPDAAERTACAGRIGSARRSATVRKCRSVLHSPAASSVAHSQLQLRLPRHRSELR